MSPFYNPYNLEIAQQLGNIYQNKIDHENLYNDNLQGGSGFAADYHLDTGYEPTLGATSTMHPVVSSSNSDLSGEMEGEGKRKYKRKPKGSGISAGGISGGKKTAKGISGGGISGGKKTAKGISGGGTSGGGETSGSGISGGTNPKRKARKKGGDFNDILDGVSHVAKTAKDVAEAVAPVAGLLALGKPKRKPRKTGGANLENPSREPYKEGGETDIPAAPIAKHAPSANKATELEAPVEKAQMPGVSVGGGKKKRTITEKMRKRNELIKKIMKERNCSLPKASQIIASEKLAY